MTPPLFHRASLDDAQPGAEIVLTGDEGRHAGRVKRVQPGETLLVADGRGTVCTCQVTAVDRDDVHLLVRARTETPAPAPSVTVVQALPKTDRGEFAVELLTEVGVDVVVPWESDRAVTRWRGDKAERGRAKWERTASEAAKQSRRPWTPQVAPLVTTTGAVERIAGAATALVLHSDDLDAGTPLADVPLTDSGEIVLVVGPEGGISPAEVERFTAAGGELVRLGPEVLRTSTAGAAALAAIAVRLGRWR
ncbi:16S rRNA (uracil(1498)-N(3))-methyltransferase [Jatrophihabitans sp. YIM 134969]